MCIVEVKLSFFLLENDPIEVIASQYMSQRKSAVLNLDGEWAVPLSRADSVLLLLL